MVSNALSTEDSNATYTDLAILMNLLRCEDGTYKTAGGEAVELNDWLRANKDLIDAGTFIRKIENNLFDPKNITSHITTSIAPSGQESVSFQIRSRDLPSHIPDNWTVVPDSENKNAKVTINGSLELLLPDRQASLVNSAGQLPSGFDPSLLYQARSHPRALQLTVFGASDAVESMGIDWQRVMSSISPDQMGVYANSLMSQLDENGNGGLLQARYKGKRVSSKQVALGLAEMPGDFINAYVVGNVGGTGGSLGACATFLYNLNQGMEAIRSGQKRVVIVGASEAPILPDVIEGYRTMGALAEDQKLIKLDGNGTIDHRRACRPFSDNCGFTLAEAAQFVILFDDALAVELGATVYGAVSDVFINADGFKQSISSPGVGNYITMAKSVASLRAVLGDAALQRTYVHAHGTGTPQNRVTESHILSEVAKTFGIEKWPVTGIKCYLGHSLAAAAADQLVNSLGVWKYGLIPGISTIDHLAEDVITDHLNILMETMDVSPTGMDAAILNSKGFGGNNASACVLAPHIVERMLTKKHGQQAMANHAKKNELVREKSSRYDLECLRGNAQPHYYYGENVKTPDDVSITPHELKISGFSKAVNLDLDNPYSDMC